MHTTGTGAPGIYARGESGASVTNSADVTTEGGLGIGTWTNNGVDEQYDIPAYGIRVRADGDGSAVSVVNSGDILTEGDGAMGILARSRDGGNASLDNSGTVKTKGSIAEGVGTWTHESGAVLPHRAIPHAIYVRAEDGQGGTASLTNSGTIETEGDGVEAIRVHGEAGASLVNTGQITTHGDKLPITDADGNFLYNHTPAVWRCGPGPAPRACSMMSAEASRPGERERTASARSR